MGNIEDALIDYDRAIGLNVNYKEPYLFRGNAKAGGLRKRI
jgi:hypothetical protein